MLEASLVEDVYPITEVQTSVRRIVARAAETGRPMVITQKGRPVAAVVEIGELERLRRLADLAEDYREIILGGEGPWLTHKEVWDDLYAKLDEASEDEASESEGDRAGSRRAS